MKKTLLILISAFMVLAFASYWNDKGSEAPSDGGSSPESSALEQTSEDASIIQKFPAEKQSHDVMDDGNYYLKVQTVNGDNVSIREFAINGKDAYSNVREKDNFVWYYSNGLATFVFDDDKKIYEVHDIKPLSVVLFSEEITNTRDCVFFDVDSICKTYKFTEDMSIMHFYRKTDGSWLGFQYVYKDGYAEANIILEASDDYPSHVVFSIPEDYKYYFQQGENEVSMDWD